MGVERRADASLSARTGRRDRTAHGGPAAAVADRALPTAGVGVHASRVDAGRLRYSAASVADVPHRAPNRGACVRESLTRSRIASARPRIAPPWSRITYTWLWYAAGRFIDEVWHAPGRFISETLAALRLRRIGSRAIGRLLLRKPTAVRGLFTGGTGQAISGSRLCTPAGPSRGGADAIDGAHARPRAVLLGATLVGAR